MIFSKLIMVYYPLILIILGTIFNLLTFIILCRTTFRNTNKQTTLHYMRIIAICDIFILFGWNFDHYLERSIGIQISTYSIITCKLLTFFNYFIHHISAWLRVLICFDRYISLNRLSPTWFNQSKNILIIIGILFLIFLLINLHFLSFVCYSENNQIKIESPYYTVYPIWNYINLIIYNCLPFLLMIIFNSGIMYHLFLLRRLSTVRKTSRIQHRTISITLLLTTSLFFLLTTPISIAGVLFPERNETIYFIFDSMLYTYHILGFPVYLFTFTEFRREFLKSISFYKCRNLSNVHINTSNQNVINRLFTISDNSLK